MTLIAANYPIPPGHMINVDAKNYVQSAAYQVGVIDQLVSLSPRARVLEVGCAAGRLALPLIDYLDPAIGGTYDGFDIRPDRIGWAQRNLGRPHIRFRHIDVRNEALNPKGAVDGATLEFPYDSQAFDVVVFHSVFTHMLPPVVCRYLLESRRVLAPGGRLYSTWFLWDDATARSVQQHEVLWRFDFDRGDHRLQVAIRPEEAVAYHYGSLTQKIARAGLRITTERRGDWRSRPTHGQDILILERQTSH